MHIRTDQQTGEKIVFIVLCLTPFLGIYEDTVVLLFTVVPLFIFVINSVLKKGRIEADFLVLFIIWSLLGTILYCLPNSTTRNNVFVLYLNLLTLSFLELKESKDAFIRIYKLFAYFCVVFLYCQVMAFYCLGMNLTFSVPFLNMSESMQTSFQYLSRYSRTVIGIRFFGPLYEPAAYSEYVAPLQILILFDNNISKKKKMIFSGIVSLSILLTLSSMGLIMVIVAWLLYFLFYEKASIKRLIIAPLGALSISVVAVYAYNNFSFIHNQVYKVLSNDPTKTGYRVFRGFDYYLQVAPFNKVIGVGYMNGINWAKQHNVFSIYDSINQQSANVEYFSGASQTLLYFGIVGCLLFVCYCVSNCHRSTKPGRMMWIMYFLLIIGSSQLFREIGAIYIAISLAFERTENDDSYIDDSLWS